MGVPKPTLSDRNLHLGTLVKLTNRENGRVVISRVNDRGPLIRERDMDLSYGLTEESGLPRKGVGKLIMEIV